MKDPLTLGQLQREFSTLVARLILKANAMGYQLTFGECWRPPETAALYQQQGKGIIQSLHSDRLAIDLNLFKNGVYLITTEDYRPLGEWWEAQSTMDYMLCWGGTFRDSEGKPNPDSDHFSLEYGGRK